MKKEYIALFLGLVLLMCAKTAFAGIIISEIMYDPDGSDTNREWIEVYNDSTTLIDIAGWKLSEEDTNHGLTPSSGGTSVPAGGYAIIALDPMTFSSEWTTSVPLFDSSFSLINSTGETISIKNPSLSVVDSVTYDPTIGASNDGNSLQKYSGSWIAADPTPGATNTNTSTTPSTTTNATSTETTNETTDQQTTTTTANGDVSTVETKPHETLWSVDITAPTYGTVGVPATFTSMAYTNEGYEVHPGLFKWNMGDGSAYNQQGNGDFVHTYLYPGTYVVTLEYYRDGSFPTLPGEVFSRINFTVYEESFEIKPAHIHNGLLDISIVNNADHEVNMQGWILEGTIHTYVFPKSTISLGGNTITVTGYISGFTEADSQKILLKDPSGNVVASFPIEVAPVVKKKISPSHSSSTTNSTKVTTDMRTVNEHIIPINDSETISQDSLSASASQAHSSVVTWWLTALALLLLGMGSVIYLRREKKEGKDDDEFEVTVIE